MSATTTRPTCELVSSCTREANGTLRHPDYGDMPACAHHVREQKWMPLFRFFEGERMTKWLFLSDEERAGHDATSCGLKCSGCGEEFATEGDFARHFTLKSSQHLNLGDCPNNPRPTKW